MNSLADELRAEHRNFEHVLQLMYTTCRLGDIGNADACRLMTNAVLYLQEFGDGVHNEKDSALLRKLLVAEPSCQDLCRHLQELRKQLRQTEQEMLPHIEAAQAGDAEACERVKTLVEVYRGLYAAYVALEEQEALPAALAVLSGRDGREIAARFTRVSDPVFGRAALQAHETPYDALMVFHQAIAH